MAQNWGFSCFTRMVLLASNFFVNGSSQLTMNLIEKNMVVKVSVDLHQLMVLWHLADKVQPWVHFSLVPSV